MQAYCTGVDEFLWLSKLFKVLYDTLKAWQPGQAPSDISHLHCKAPVQADDDYVFDPCLEKVKSKMPSRKKGKQQPEASSASASEQVRLRPY